MLTLLATLLQVGQVAPSPRPSPPTWSLSRDLQIDGEQADLVSISFLRVAANGTMAVGQPQDVVVRFFAADGTDLGRYGRQGDGPDEFTRLPSFAGYHENQFWIVDPQLDRATILTSERKRLRSITVPHTMTTAQGKALEARKQGTPQAITPAGDLIYVMHFARPEPAVWQSMVGNNESLFFRISPAGVLQGTTAVASGIFYCLKTFVVVLPSAMCRDYQGSFSPDGKRILTNESSSLSTAGQYRITSIATNGDTLFSRTFSGDKIAIPKKTTDSLRADRIKRLPAQQEAWKKATFPEYYPAVSQVLGGRDGTTWVQLRPTPASRRWIVLDEKGAPIGAVTVPANVEIEAADRANVWATVKDDDGLPSIVRYGIVK